MIEEFQKLTGHLSISITNIIVIVASVLAGFVIRFLIFKSLKIYLRHRENFAVQSLIRRLKGSMLLLIPTFLIIFFMPLIHGSAGSLSLFSRIIQVLFITSFAWLLIKLTYVSEDILFNKLNISKEDNYRERKMRTQIQYIRRLTIIVIIVIAISLIFMRFESMRRLGTGLITSAGILGIIMGLAAQRSIANLLAGLQIAFTQPIRIDDVVIIEGEWGKIEEINLTYIVVKIWDLRRLVLPITYVVEKPFQNWTRVSAEIMGTVFLYTDYSIPVEEVRQELYNITSRSPLWDRKVCGLQVTDAKERTMELRCLISARNSSDAFDLRCLIREELLKFIHQNYPESLPRVRAELDNTAKPESRTTEKPA